MGMRGYRWAAIERRADMITNIDGDLLLVKDFFSQAYTRYQEIKADCSTPIWSGYTSAIEDTAYGANYLFDRDTYEDWVMESLSECRDFRTSNSEMGFDYDYSE